MPMKSGLGSILKFLFKTPDQFHQKKLTLQQLLNSIYSVTL